MDWNKKMLLTTLALSMALGVTTFDEKPLVCPIMGSPINAKSPKAEYEGISVGFCCGGCDAQFAKDPQAIFKKNEKSANPIGAFLFDPVSHKRIKPEQAKGTVDYNGVRYYFFTAENMTAFQADSKKFAAVPKKESLTCPVMGDKVATYSKATDYVDFEGVRYYICCSGCVAPMEKDGKKYAGKDVQEPKVIMQKA